MNILFVLYYDMSCNSATHADGLCRALMQDGHACAIAVPHEPTRAELFAEAPYRVLTHAQALAGAAAFPRGGADVIHAWTPRESVRPCALQLAAPRTTRLCVHLEDNEEELTRTQLGALRYALRREGLDDSPFPPHLSHPVHAGHFVAGADGVSALVDELVAGLGAGAPTVVFWPSADDNIFFPRAPDPGLREELGLPPGATMLCYHGNAHASNWAEVRSLYLAVALLNREGHAARLVRTGRDFVDQGPDYREWAAQFSIELGFVEERAQLGRLVAEADVLVQPGEPNAFNNLRFPSKLADFFASGKPVVLPRTNVGRVTRHGEDAYVLDVADGTAIADAVAAIMGDAALRQRLSEGARAFYQRHLQWSVAARRLLSMYETILAAPPRRSAA